MNILRSYEESEWQTSGLTRVVDILLNECTVLGTTPASRHEMILQEREYIKAFMAGVQCAGVSGDDLERYRSECLGSRKHNSVDICALMGEGVPPAMFVECKYRKGEVESPDRQVKMRKLFSAIQSKFRHMSVLFKKDSIAFNRRKYVVFSNRMAPIFKMAYNDYCVAAKRRLAYRIVSTMELRDVLKAEGYAV